MEAILYICHGSRSHSAVCSAVNFVNKIIEKFHYPIQEISFIELVNPTISDGLEACITRGATTIYVLPVLLLSANHVKVDIPSEISLLKKKYPSIEIKLSNPIGVHQNMILLIKKRIEEKIQLIDKNDEILLIGRGSSDPLALDDFSSIVKKLESKLNRNVSPAFMAVSHPSVHEAFDKLLSKKMNNKVIIVPYLLFSGTLMKDLVSHIHTLPKGIQENFVVCDTIGYDELITCIFKERINELKSTVLQS